MHVHIHIYTHIYYCVYVSVFEAAPGLQMYGMDTNFRESRLCFLFLAPAKMWPPLALPTRSPLKFFRSTSLLVYLGSLSVPHSQTTRVGWRRVGEKTIRV